jgi:hypothetical protein
VDPVAARTSTVAIILIHHAMLVLLVMILLTFAVHEATTKGSLVALPTPVSNGCNDGDLVCDIIQRGVNK